MVVGGQRKGRAGGDRARLALEGEGCAGFTPVPHAAEEQEAVRKFSQSVR